jgi:hypothetical protein
LELGKGHLESEKGILTSLFLTHGVGHSLAFDTRHAAGRYDQDRRECDEQEYRDKDEALLTGDVRFGSEVGAMSAGHSRDDVLLIYHPMIHGTTRDRGG